MHSIYNEGEPAVAERFIRTLKTKTYKYMTSVSKNMYIDKLDDIADEYNNTYQKTIEMKPVDVKDKMLTRAYSLITNKITRSFNMVLLGEINNSNQYIIKIY